MGELEADREVLVSARLSPGWRLQPSVTFVEGPDYNHLIDISNYPNGISEMITYILWGAIVE